jgi:hypothetical protein
MPVAATLANDMSSVSEEIKNRLYGYVNNNRKVILQVKDLEPTAGARHFIEPNKYITGRIVYNGALFSFIEDGQQPGEELQQDILIANLGNVDAVSGGRRRNRKNRKNTKSARRNHGSRKSRRN